MYRDVMAVQFDEYDELHVAAHPVPPNATVSTSR